MADNKEVAGVALPVSAAQVEQSFSDLVRNLSASAVQLQEALAVRLGLSASEGRCLDIIRQAEMEGSVTPSLLAERTGLTSGAITGLLDRLEAARFVRRDKSPNDRRQVFVRSIADREAELSRLYEPYARAYREQLAQYQPAELLVVGRFVRETLALVERYTHELDEQARAQRAGAPAPLHDVSVPLAELRSATLEIARGASGLRLAEAERELLYRVATDGALPELALQQETLRFQQKRGSFLDFKRQRLDLLLNPTIPWQVRVKGGLSHCRFELGSLLLSGLEILGGLSAVELQLPAPRGRVGLLLKGGASQLSVLRPAGAALRVIVHSGASGLSLDNLQLGSVGGRTEWQSPDYAQALDKFDLEVMGGASKLSVGVRSA
ncbi:MAG: MarR family transcriptional regulator [Polyangiaceae bacterium]